VAATVLETTEAPLPVSLQ